MKKTLFTLFICLIASFSYANSIFIEGFEYANNDLTPPVGWTCNDDSWLCGYLDKDHNRIPHSGNWYAFTNAEDSWMFMSQYFSPELKYRPSYWAISDGTFEVEFWAGNEASPTGMTALLFTATVSSGTYERFTEYVESLPSNYEYFGIHAIAHEGAYHLTIDDINIDMVERYNLEVTPYTFDTILYPGSEITIEYEVQNTGYEDLHVYMTPYTEFFTNITFTEDGFNYASFPTVPDQIVHCTCTATLLPDISPGTRCWIDIMFTVSCDCVTRMATLWVTVADPTEVGEHQAEPKLFPNPTNDHIIIHEKGLQQVEIIDISGKTLLHEDADHEELRLDLSRLNAGIYVVKTVSEQGCSTQKIVKQ